MIFSTLHNSRTVEALHPRFRELFEFLRHEDLSSLKPGRIVLDGDNLFINYDVAQGVDKEKQHLEIHRKYIDVHIPLSGPETVGWKPAEKLENEIKPFEKGDDYALYSDKPSIFVEMVPGDFMVFFPEDAHAPLIGQGEIRKLIAKIKI